MLTLRQHLSCLFCRVLLCCLLLIALNPLHAAEPASPTAQPAEKDSLCKFPPIRDKPVIDPNIPANRTQLQADEADMSQKNLTRFSGSVVIQRGGRRIEADKAEYSRRNEDFDATGHVRLLTNELEIEADKAKMNLKKNQGTLQNTRYRTLPENANGTAKQITVHGPHRMTMQDATYTTCPPDDRDWELSASEINLDSESRQGSASHVVIDFKGVPFLYLPYLRFPLGDDRLSGLLMPTFATSNERGTEISVPYYWNIAPERDATITAHNMSRRGLMWENEFRYLGEQSQGQMEFDYLGSDKLYGDTRQRVKWHHEGQAGAGWSTTLDFQKVSDNDYLKDFAGSLGARSQSYLEQRATLNYNAPSWQFTALAQDYQTLAGAQPYRKLPQLTLGTRLPERDNRLNFNAGSEWVRFDHSDKSLVTTDRSHLQPTISLPLRNQAAFFIPRVTGYFTQYRLNENAPQADKSPSSGLAVSSLDAGVFLERDTSMGDTPLVQTFEPRLYYVYAPYRDQSDQPVFDTGRIGFSFNSLFRENRFTGIDRVGDTNRLTVALTTRFLHSISGAELFSASLGRVYYYSDRRVTLPGGSPETENNSDYIANLTARPADHWTLSSDAQWDEDTHHTRYSTTRLSYNRDNDHLLSLGYRYRQNEMAIRELGLVWRFTPRWRILGSYQYDSLNQRRLETIYGLNYDSCCWGLRILAREYYNGQINGQDNYQNAIYLVFELKGLSSFGNQSQTTDILQQSIPGYTH